jgi:hypothetical protein
VGLGETLGLGWPLGSRRRLALELQGGSGPGSRRRPRGSRPEQPRWSERRAHETVAAGRDSWRGNRASPGPPACGRLRRRRPARARALCRGAGCPGWCGDHLRQRGRGTGPASGERSPSCWRLGTQRGGRDATAPGGGGCSRGGPWEASRRPRRVRPEGKAPASAGCVRMARTAATLGGCQTRAPTPSRRGRRRWGVWHASTTWLAERHGQNGSHTSVRRAGASWVGICRTRPRPARPRPVGRRKASAPRSAWWRSPAVRRAGIGCRSHADRVPCTPKRRRPWTVDGASRPSPSALQQPLEPHRAHRGSQSEPVRESRVTS